MIYCHVKDLRTLFSVCYLQYIEKCVVISSEGKIKYIERNVCLFPLKKKITLFILHHYHPDSHSAGTLETQCNNIYGHDLNCAPSICVCVSIYITLYCKDIII